MRHRDAKGCQYPVADLLPERDAGKRCELLVKADLMEGEHPAGPGEARGHADEGGGIDLMNQDMAADHEIERLRIREFLDRRFLELDVLQPRHLSALPADREDLRAAVDPDDAAGRTDQL